MSTSNIKSAFKQNHVPEVYLLNKQRTCSANYVLVHTQTHPSAEICQNPQNKDNTQELKSFLFL